MRNWVAKQLLSLGMAIAGLGDRLYHGGAPEFIDSTFLAPKDALDAYYDARPDRRSYGTETAFQHALDAYYNESK